MNAQEKEIIKAKMQAIFNNKIDQWIESQENQTDGFEYERSYVETMQEVASEIFQLSVGEVAKSKNQKKTSNQSRSCNCP